jgi:transposase
MTFTEEHYEKLLGFGSPWSVIKVELNEENLKIDVYIDNVAEQLPCPECGKKCRVYDRAGMRTWRHLDTMQCTTLLHSSVPRITCKEHGVKTVTVPWSEKHSRFTLSFESYAIKVLKASRSTEEARKLLKVNWHPLHSIMKRSVARGLNRREETEISWIGMDEKSFRSGHDYISLMTDVEESKVLDVVEGRDSEVAEKLIHKSLTEEQQAMVCGVAIDMSAPFKSAITKLLPHADIVHDKFHISKHLNDAVDKTRRKEHRQMQKKNDHGLKGTKFIWLKGMEHLSDEALAQLEELKALDLNVSKAWHLKEMFRHFWNRRDKQFAQSFFEFWHKLAFESGLPEIQKVARMLKKNLSNILTYFDCYITNAVTEGINSKIQTIKANARGYRNFENYRISILFYCGKLNLLP